MTNTEQPSELQAANASLFHNDDLAVLGEACRTELEAIADQSASGAKIAVSDGAMMVLMAIARDASFAAQSDLPTSKLIRLRGTLQLLLEGARHLERIHRNG
jgi:hypothetical protein